jgi:hypothetical protein
MTSKLCIAISLVAALLLGTVACREEGPAETAGRMVDEAVEDAGEAGEEATERAAREFDEAVDETKEELEKEAQEGTR